VKNARFERVSALEQAREDAARGDARFLFRPFETVTLRLTGDVSPIRKAAPKEPWTGLLIHPRAFPAGKGGKTYLLWGTDDSPDFDHYEIARDGRKIADVENIVDEGILYRNARYEDDDVEFGRHIYHVRSIYKGGRSGDWVEFQ
jgi:hypothetical protein